MGLATPKRKHGEQKYVNQLPEVPDQLFDSETVISVADSKEGWAKALRQLIALLYSGEVARYDLSKIRPAGARLKTFGGRASGPGPLDELFRFTITKFRGAVGRKLTSIECHDLLCKIGEVVVVGGVRRSAMISLSDLEDDRMRHAKSGDWWTHNGHRALANNSATYNAKPDIGQFLQEWTSLYNSHSGERGIFSRAASKSQATKNGRRDSNYEFGTNPCSEIILRPYQFCNLTEVVVRAGDTVESLARKVRIATILGTFQSTLTHFPYLRKIWQKNTEEERLLGVSLTGILDNKWMGEVSDSTAKALEQLRKVSVNTNAEFAAILKVPQSAAITCVKPSGTVSQLVNSASGIHTRHSPYYIRRVRGDKKDPLTKFLTEAGIPTEDLYFSQNGKGFNNVTRLRWLEGNLYTGLLNGGIITAATGSTTYQISSGSGIIVNLNASLSDDPYPVIKYLEWGKYFNTTGLHLSINQLLDLET